MGFVARDLHGADALGLLAEQPVRALFYPRTITSQQQLSKLSETAKDGDEIYVLADSANGVRWRFRFNAASTSAYRWEFVGGPPLVATVDVQETTASTTAVDIATVGPTVTTPVGGDFVVTMTVRMAVTGTAGYVFGCLSVGGAAATDQLINGPAVNQETSTARSVRQSSVAASSAFKLQYRVSAGTVTGFFHWRTVSVVPVRVG